ncbi:MAG: hypothetical protein ACLQLE_03610 [Desulfobaccales bacterium]
MAAINHSRRRNPQRRRGRLERLGRLEHLERLERLDHLERLRQNQKKNRRGISGYILAKRIYPLIFQIIHIIN